MNAFWSIDDDGFIISPSGAKCARLTQRGLELWDKRAKRALLFTIQDWYILMQYLNQKTIAVNPENTPATPENTPDNLSHP